MRMCLLLANGGVANVIRVVSSLRRLIPSYGCSRIIMIVMVRLAISSCYLRVGAKLRNKNVRCHYLGTAR
jgi:hypothetical protein